MIYTKALQLPYMKLLCDESHGYPNRGFGFFFFGVAKKNLSMGHKLKILPKLEAYWLF